MIPSPSGFSRDKDKIPGYKFQIKNKKRRDEGLMAIYTQSEKEDPENLNVLFNMAMVVDGP